MTSQQFNELKLRGYTEIKWTEHCKGYLTEVDRVTRRIWIGKKPNTPRAECREFVAADVTLVTNVEDRRPLLHEQLKACDERLKDLRDRRVKHREDGERLDKLLKETMEERQRVSKELDHE